MGDGGGGTLPPLFLFLLLWRRRCVPPLKGWMKLMITCDSSWGVTRRPMRNKHNRPQLQLRSFCSFFSFKFRLWFCHGEIQLTCLERSDLQLSTKSPSDSWGDVNKYLCFLLFHSTDDRKDEYEPLSPEASPHAMGNSAGNNDTLCVLGLVSTKAPVLQ